MNANILVNLFFIVELTSHSLVSVDNAAFLFLLILSGKSFYNIIIFNRISCSDHDLFSYYF